MIFTDLSIYPRSMQFIILDIYYAIVIIYWKEDDL